ncbi:MAG: hypothetical protein DWQ37_12000 [Planctomycetota bacterium]|nr:MAG: hypothetical protein DWQ37_12000 [Planctomycetota bacterium]
MGPFRLMLVRLLALFLLGSAAAAAHAAKPDTSSAVFVMQRDGSDVRRVVFIESFPRLSLPRWSPDGERLLFEAGGDRSPRSLVVDATGRNLLDLGLGVQADWSPDGKQVVYAVPSESGPNVWVQNADGKAGTRLCPGSAPRWSPDGASIAVCGPLRLFDTFSGTLRALIDAAAGVERTLGCAWSPDGERLAAIVERGDKRELVVIDPTQVTRALDARWQAEFDGPPAWSPDGKHLAVTIHDPVADLRRINVLEVEGDEPPRLIAGQQGDNRDPSWSPDSKQLAYIGTNPP